MRIKVLIGQVTEINNYRVEDIKDSYYPYAKEFTDFYNCISWAFKAKEPLLGDKYLAVITERLDYPKLCSRLDRLVKDLDELKYMYVDFLMVVDLVGQSGLLPYRNKIEYLRLSQTYKDDYKRYITSAVPMTEEGYSEIIRRLGMSIQAFNNYLPLLREALAEKDKEVLTPTIIKGVIKERRLPPIDEILTGLILDKKKGLRNHYLLCDKYSRNWVLDYYEGRLDIVLDLKRKVANKEILINDTLQNKDNRLLYTLVSMAPIRDVFYLKSLLGVGGNIRNSAIELYVGRRYTNYLGGII